jgi:hypothetical protein
MIESKGPDAFADPRGNAFLKSYCTTEGRGRDRQQPKEEVKIVHAPKPPPVHPSSDAQGQRDDFMREARQP